MAFVDPDRAVLFGTEDVLPGVVFCYSADRTGIGAYERLN